MQRLWIHTLLPAGFCAAPVAAAALIFAAVPPDARRDYLERMSQSPIDWVILSVGTLLFLSQTTLAFRALRWREGGFDERNDKFLSHLGQAAEWFPLLGLIGTVAAILQTFSSIAPGTSPTAQEIIKKYAPAITATGSGLFMALINILPGWIATTGRELIARLAGDADIELTPADPARGAKP